MFVLGIDPGLSRCRYSCRAAASPGRGRGVIRTDPELDLPHRLAEMQLELRSLIAELRPDVVAVERVLFQHNVSTAMGVGMASGLAMAEAAAAGCDVAEYSPNEIKQAVAGFGSAGKHEIGDGPDAPRPVQEVVSGRCRRRHRRRAVPSRPGSQPSYPSVGRLVSESEHAMIGSLRGRLLDRGSDGELLVEVGGLGYRVQVTPSTSVTIGEPDGEVFVHTPITPFARTPKPCTASRPSPSGGCSSR